MWGILLFRICFVLSFVLSAWKWGDIRNWQKYYATILFVMAVNLSTTFISYHHQLWVFRPDAIFTTETVIELFNTYFVLPATVLLYLANYPTNGLGVTVAYIVAWTILYFGVEFIDANYIGGIAYRHGWSYWHSLLFDFVMFSLIRLHFVIPILAWTVTLILAFFIMLNFGILSGEMK